MKCTDRVSQPHTSQIEPTNIPNFLTADTDVSGGGEIKLGKVAAAKNVSHNIFYLYHSEGLIVQVKKKKRAPKVGYARDEENDMPEPAVAPVHVDSVAPVPVATLPETAPAAAPAPVIPPKNYLQAREEAMQKSRMIGTGISIELPPSSPGTDGADGQDGRTSPSVESEHSEDADRYGLKNTPIMLPFTPAMMWFYQRIVD